MPGYNEGFFQVQDEAAQLATTLLGPFIPAAEYLDGCAGLGGKTSHLLQLAKQHNLRITAVEPEPYRLKKLRDNIARLFPGNGLIVNAGTLQQFSTLCTAPLFHGILIDAPCSGTGVTGRHPDIRWNRRPEELLHYQQEQIALLSLAATLVRQKGGYWYTPHALLNRKKTSRSSMNFCEPTRSSPLPIAPHTFRNRRINLSKIIFSIPIPLKQLMVFFAARMERT